MRRLIASIIALLAIIPLFSQGTKGTWNPTTCTYTNSVHKISWKLPSEIGWKRVDATGPNICFKAIDPETGVMLILNIKTDTQYGTDIWPLFESMNSKDYLDQLKKSSRAAGVPIKSISQTKSQIDGVHAIKRTTSLRKNDPAYGGEVDMYGVSYTFIKDNKLYSVDIQALQLIKDELEGFDQILNMIFGGVKITK